MRITNAARRAPLSALLALPLLLAVLTGCTATEGAPGGQGQDPDEFTATAADFQDWHLKYAKCMREQGIDMPDPDENGMSEAMSIEDYSIELLDAAEAACRESVGPPPPMPGGEVSDAELQAQTQKFADCFRANGIDVADPEPGMGLSYPADTPDEIVLECNETRNAVDLPETGSK